MWSRSLDILFRIACAATALKCLVDLARGSQFALAFMVVFVPVSIVLFVRARGSAGKIGPVAVAKSEQGAAVFRQLDTPDQVRIASLVASGNKIGAIKALRELVNIGLRDAKDVVDELAVSNHR